MFWGITPALDLFKEVCINSKRTELNVLIIGGSDARHVLKTISKKYLHENVKLNFYLMEGCLESVAKQLLLLNIAFQKPQELGLTQKTRYFMELYGNSLIRPAVAKYLHNTAEYFVKLVTNPEYMKEKMPFVQLDVKYKERDYLENLFKFWCGSDDFNIFDCWDRRLRKNLGVRYDTKSGVFDWDLHMRYHLIGGKQICSQEYQNFRLSGIAFTWLESEASKPNRSMVCGVIPNGKYFAHYGYLGDMETGPFVSYGLDCEDENFLRQTNGKHVHRATDVTERNLKQIFYEIQNGEDYIHVQTNDLALGSVVTQLSGVKVVDVGAGGESGKIKENTYVDLHNVNIKFLSLSYFPTMKYKSKYKNLFDLVYFNSRYLKYFDDEVVKHVCKENAFLLFENQIFVLSHRDKQLEEYEEQINKAVEPLNALKIDFDVKKDFYVKFIVN